jgi:hypothetical protein
MDLLILVAVVVLIGFVTWLLTENIPMPQDWKRPIQVLVLLVVLLWVVGRFLPLPNVLH